MRRRQTAAKQARMDPAKLAVSRLRRSRISRAMSFIANTPVDLFYRIDGKSLAAAYGKAVRQLWRNVMPLPRSGTQHAWPSVRSNRYNGFFGPENRRLHWARAAM